MNHKRIILIAGMAFAGLSLMSQAQTSPLPPEAQILPPELDQAGLSIVGNTRSQSSFWGDFSLSLQSPDDKIVGFSFVNRGLNSIVTREEQEGEGPARQFEMQFRSRARQEIQFRITDIPTGSMSQRMESYFFFFPRLNLPAIQSEEKNSLTFTVILATGEPVIFNAKTKEILGGVLKETTPIDLGGDRNLRKFAGIQYTGKGVYLRVNRRGNDPRIGTIATLFQGEKTCTIPAKELFNQDIHSQVEFLYPTDEEFNALLKKKCDMSFL